MISFDKLIENHLQRESKAKQEGRYYPSEIGMCMRKIWYSYKQPIPIKMDMIKVFEVGNILHAFITNVIRSEKNPHVELEAEELPFKIQMSDFWISGRIDDVMIIKENNKRVLIEVKSTSDLRYADEASEHHVLQLQLYMHAMKIYDGMVLYIEKNTLKTKSFTIPYDERIAADALNRFVQLHRFLINNEFPKPESRLSNEKSWMCRNCEYNERCFKDTPEI